MDNLSYAEELRSRYDYEHPQYTRDEWRQEVRDDNTLLGYWEWVAHRIEEDEG